MVLEGMCRVPGTFMIEVITKELCSTPGRAGNLCSSESSRRAMEQDP